MINIFGGITRCDEVAKGVVEALNEVKTNKPIFIRLKVLTRRRVGEYWLR